jgi:hypothetical protein
VGSKIDRQFRTSLEKLGSTRVQAIAVAGPAQTLLAVAGETWVLKVEEDKPVSRQAAKPSARN